MVTFQGVSTVSEAQQEKHAEYSKGLNLPTVASYPVKGPLAIVGSGHSAALYKYTLQSWPGTVWAVNRAWRWSRDNAIDAVFFSFDPAPSVGEMLVGADKAILTYKMDPSVFHNAKEMWISEASDGGTTSVGAAVATGVECGFSSITLFGCEACMQPDSSHINAHFSSDDEMVVWCNGMHFYTTARMFIGGIEISNMIKVCPLVKELSGGMLRAMVEAKEEPKIVGASPSLHGKLFIAA
jgi:hypothetical protein